jgi:hypothetical protein
MFMLLPYLWLRCAESYLSLEALRICLFNLFLYKVLVEP